MKSGLGISVTDLTALQIAQAEDHIAYEGVVELRKWIDTSAQGFKLTLGLSNRNQLDQFDGVMSMRKSRGGQRYHAIIQPYWTTSTGERKPDSSQMVQQEWQFAGRGWSEGSGAHIAIHIGDREPIIWWRQKKCADQVEAEARGGIYYIMLLELDDDETIVNQEKRDRVIPPELPKGGPRSKAVARTILDPEFGLWLNKRSLYRALEDPCRYDLPAKRDALVKRTCGMASKVELDNGNEAAWQMWELQFLRPFIQWSQQRWTT
jgi:hypothetical protein